MPLYLLICPLGHTRRSVMSRDDFRAKAPHQCECGESMDLKPPSVSCSPVDRLDNGRMARAVERPSNIHELVKDHKKAGG